MKTTSSIVWMRWWSRPLTTSAPAPNPRYPLMKEIKQMYLRAYYGAGADK